MSKGGTTSAGSATEIPQWVQDAGRKQYQTGTELGQIGYTPYYGADVAAFNPLQTAAFDSTGMAANAFGMGGGSPTFATDGIQAPQTFAGGMRGYSGMPMYTEALNTLEQQRPFQKQQLEQQFIDPTTGLTPEGRKIQDINSLYNEAFNRNVGLEGVSTYLPLVQQGMTQNELRRVLYDSPEAKALGKSSLGAPIEIGVGGGLLGGAEYVPPALVSGSSGVLDSVTGAGSTVVDTGSTVANTGSTVNDGLLSTVADVASGQRLIGDILTDTDMSTATPSTFDLYGSQIDQLMPIYQQELGRGLQDSEALAYYGEELKSGRMTPEQVRANIASSIEGQDYITPAEQAAIDAQNSANLGFGTSSTTGGQADNFVPNMPAYLGDDVVFPDGEYMGSFENGFTNLLEGGGLTGAIGNVFSNLIGGSETEKVNTVSQATGMSTSEVGNLIQNMAGAAGSVVANGLKVTPAGILVQQLFPDLFNSTSNNNVDVIDKGITTSTANNTYDVNNAINFKNGLLGGGL